MITHPYVCYTVIDPAGDPYYYITDQIARPEILARIYAQHDAYRLYSLLGQFVGIAAYAAAEQSARVRWSAIIDFQTDTMQVYYINCIPEDARTSTNTRSITVPLSRFGISGFTASRLFFSIK